MPDDAPAPGPDGVPTTAIPPAPEESREDWESRFKYLLADFENFRRRTAKEREGTTRQARAALLRELLPLLEGFRAASEAVARLPSSDPLRKGFELLDREWAKFLKREGVEPVAAVGQSFQPDEAEAVGELPADPSVPEGSVREVVQQGYRFYGGLLRPAKVIVARAKAAERTPEGAPEGPPPEAES